MKKQLISIKIDAELLERLRNTAFWIGQGTTVTGILEAGAAKEVGRLEREHNKGERFKSRKEKPA